MHVESSDAVSKAEENGSTAVSVPVLAVPAMFTFCAVSGPTTVTEIVLLVDPSEIETVVVPAAAELIANVAGDPGGMAPMLTIPVGKLDTKKVPGKFVSVAVALNEVVPVVPTT